jgi:ribonuclease P protein component
VGLVAAYRCAASGEPVSVADSRAEAVAAGRFDLYQGRSVPLTLDLCCPPGSTACAEPTSVCSTTEHDHAGRAANAASAPIVMERDREQADLPTEQPPSGEDPRVPASDAHSRRSRHPGGPPPQGSHRTVGLSRLLAVLPAAHRLRSSADFATVTRSGRRVRSGDLVVYLAGADQGDKLAARPVSDQTSSRPAKAGLIVSRQVGGSVVRHQVSRRLRAQLAGRIPTLPAGSRLVVRALPSAAVASSQVLGRQLDAAFGKLTGPKPAKAVR